MLTSSVAARLLLLAIILFPAASLRAWDEEGHVLMARIAYDRLTEPAQKSLREALDGLAYKGPSYADPLQAARYMDVLRIRTAQPGPDYWEGLFATWHYITLPYPNDVAPLPKGNELDANGKADVVRAWWFVREVFASGKKQTVNYDNKMQFDVGPREALGLLLHLTGDAHQPLHTTSHVLSHNGKEDFGGNLVKITNAEPPSWDSSPNPKRNLHSFWDSAYRMTWRDTPGMPKAVEDETISISITAGLDDPTLQTLAAALVKKYSPTKNELEVLTPEEWVRESHRFGHDNGYEALGSDQLGKKEVVVSEQYVSDAREIASRRIVLAGCRLAAILEKLLLKP